MKTTTITIPIFELQIIAVLDGWQEANTYFGFGMKPEEFDHQGLTMVDGDQDSIIYILLKSEHKSVLFHELYHVMSRICDHTGIIPDPKNDEALAHMQEFVGSELAKFIGYGQHIKS